MNHQQFQTALAKAHCLLFPSSDEQNLPEYQKAKETLEYFDVRVLGVPLAVDCLNEIINHVSFPTADETRDSVGKAEGLQEELLDIGGYHEIHMDEAATIETLRWEGMSVEEIAALYKKSPTL